MKKILFAASLFLAIAVSAQETQERKRPEKPTTEQQMKQFDDYNLSADQKQKIQALYKERDEKFANNKGSGEKPQKPKNGEKPKETRNKSDFEGEGKDFDTKIEKILTKEQYTKYHSNKNKNKKHDSKDRKSKSNVN